jgi:hypothetical protein
MEVAKYFLFKAPKKLKICIENKMARWQVLTNIKPVRQGASR